MPQLKSFPFEAGQRYVSPTQPSFASITKFSLPIYYEIWKNLYFIVLGIMIYYFEELFRFENVNDIV